MLIDTDVLIWMTRGHVGAANRLQTIQAWHARGHGSGPTNGVI